MEITPGKIAFTPEFIAKRFPHMHRAATEQPEPTPEEIAEGERRRAARAAGKRRRDAEAFARCRGARYADCRIENYQCDQKGQDEALDKLRRYLDNAPEEITRGNNVILFGPSGTGKDHLLTAIAFATIDQHGRRPTPGDDERRFSRDDEPQGRFSFEWRTGAELFGFLRDGMNQEHNERKTLDPLIRCDVLIFCDPLPPGGELTRYQGEILYRVLDARYSACRPTWVSLNVSNSTEAAARLGAAVHDRLRHGALAIFCNWKTHRTPKA